MTRRLRDSASRLSLLALSLAVALPAHAAAQSAEEVVNEALERFEQRMEGVQNYTVVQEVMGFESTTTFQRKDVGGHVVFVPEQTRGTEAAQQGPQSYNAMLTELGERAEHRGTESVDGTECHLLVLEDFSGDGFSSFQPPESAGDWKPERLRFYVDTDELLPRKMTMEGTSTVDGESRDVTFTALFRDYRDVDGVVHPFRTEIRTEGMAPSMTPEERERMQESMEQLRQKMEQMSPEQREMMKKMMGGQLEKMQKMLSSGAMDFTVRVKEVRVNEGGSS